MLLIAVSFFYLDFHGAAIISSAEEDADAVMTDADGK
jgi:hypothetical protein